MVGVALLVLIYPSLIVALALSDAPLMVLDHVRVGPLTQQMFSGSR